MAIDSFVISIFLILLFGRLLGELARRLGSPAVVGEIMAGLLIGPSILGWVTPHNTLSVLAELGVILLLFDIGCDTSIKRLYHARGHSTWVALSGILVPAVVASTAAAYWLNLPSFTALFFGCALTATSIGISIRVMAQAKQTQTIEGQVILGAAVIDDIAGVILLSILLNFHDSGSLSVGSILILTIKVIGFLLIAPPFARVLIYLARGLQPQFNQSGYAVFIVITLICLFAWLAHLFGAPALLGGFAVGMALSKQFISPINRYLRNPFHFTHQLEKSTKPLIDIFAPIFFVYVGITVDLSQLELTTTGLLLLLWLALIAILTKLAAGLTAKGSWRRKLIIGCAMVPRGEVGLVFAEMGRQASIISPKLFTELVMVIVVTTIAGPLMLKWSLKGQRLIHK
ncbi:MULTISPECIES: cation:proton antiporter [unclassified Shewanella]|uniref:cation:proton antiporter n=1 Tax=unclassified Shewanella TaxID=196818 RepID=UPI000C7B9C2B|nr:MULTISPECIES: cation:proton antiporter [unclassified Shewanella]PKG55288.1 cation:proton antiporter [Shewanella sp. GutDb-MelDb]PKG73636.1 cation:proton antiporter [Shewanella sp. GutCb]